jgi:hypothetical protein
MGGKIFINVNQNKLLFLFQGLAHQIVKIVYF